MDSATFKLLKMPKPDDRLKIAPLGEPYMDRLEVERFLKDSSIAQEATSLLRAKLMEREPFRKKLVKELAAKRGLTYEEMWSDILTGKAQSLNGEEVSRLEELRSEEATEE